jgi:DNA-directed RNA polymerase specialized sigma24 family protein
MNDITQILSRIEAGDPQAAERFLPLVYDELRKLAAAKLAQEKPGQKLSATALVHEAYIRLVDQSTPRHWDILGLEAALQKLEREAPRKAELVKLRFFAGLTTAQAAQTLGASVTTAENDWTYARSWLRLEPSSRGGDDSR